MITEGTSLVVVLAVDIVCDSTTDRHAAGTQYGPAVTNPAAPSSGEFPTAEPGFATRDAGTGRSLGGQTLDAHNPNARKTSSACPTKTTSPNRWVNTSGMKTRRFFNHWCTSFDSSITGFNIVRNTQIQRNGRSIPLISGSSQDKPASVGIFLLQVIQETTLARQQTQHR